MDDLIEFLRAQLDDDERVARECGNRWDAPGKPAAFAAGFGQGNGVVEHIDRWGPARVLAEVAAKRRIIDVLRSYEPSNEWDTQPDMGLRANNAAGALRALALPYADRPGYRDEWRPA